MALAANVLVAVGGDPDFLDPALRPHHPGVLAHHRPELELHLAPVSPELIHSTFMVVERPGAADARHEVDAYHTLGRFYAAIESAIQRLSSDARLFNPLPGTRQLAGHLFYGVVASDGGPFSWPGSWADGRLSVIEPRPPVEAVANGGRDMPV